MSIATHTHRSPTPRELWLEERCKYLEECIESLGFKTDPESFYAHRSELMANDGLEPNVYVPVSSIHVPWVARVEVGRDLSSFGWEVKVRTNATKDQDYYGVAIHAEPLRYGKSQLASYARDLLEDMMAGLVRGFWGRTSK